MTLFSPRCTATILLVTLSAATSPAIGQEAGASALEPARYGPRVGFSVDPDQLVLGAFLGFDEFLPGFRARPSVDLGFGDDLFSILLNGDFQYDFTETGLEAIPFAGAGLALAYYNFSSSLGDGSETEIGVSLYGGMEFDLGGYKSAIIELRVGIDKLPDIKLIGALGFF